MSVTIPNPLTHGPAICRLTLMSNTAGVLAEVGSYVELVGHLDDVRLSSQKRTEEISDLSTVHENYAPIKLGTRISLTEILKETGTNILAEAYYSDYDYVKINLTRGAQTFGPYYGLMENYDDQTPSGKSTGVLTVLPVGIGSKNPTSYG